MKKVLSDSLNALMEITEKDKTIELQKKLIDAMEKELIKLRIEIEELKR